MVVNRVYMRGDESNMDNAELGRRLKAARLAKKMTQSDVVGDFITTNMLSQIESSSATPSMKTLEYLAGVLVSLGEAQMREIIRADGALRVHWHYCNTDYVFTDEDADKLFPRKQ